MGSDIDTIVAVYTGQAVGSLVSVGYDDDIDYPDILQSEVTFPVVGGVTYRIAVDGVRFDDDEGRVDVHLTFAPRAVNDMFARPTRLAGWSVERLNDSNVLATAEPGEPSHDWHPAEHSVWYRWMAPADGPVTIDMTGSAFDTVLAVYRGSALSDLRAVVSNDDIEPGVNEASRVRFRAVAGVVYRIAVDGASYDQGRIVLHLSGAQPTYRPDAMIRRSNARRWVGDGVYSASARGQTVTARQAPGQSVTFLLQVHNDGTGVDRVRVTGPGASRRFGVRYLAGRRGSTDITAAVLAGTYRIRLDPGERAYLRLVVTVGDATPGGASQGYLMTFGSTYAGTRLDAVKAVVGVRSTRMSG